MHGSVIDRGTHLCLAASVADLDVVELVLEHLAVHVLHGARATSVRQLLWRPVRPDTTSQSRPTSVPQKHLRIVE